MSPSAVPSRHALNRPATNDSLTSAHGPEKAIPIKVHYAVEVRRRWWLLGLRKRVSREGQRILEMNRNLPLVNGEISPPMDPLDEVNGAERDGCEKALNSSVRSNGYGR